MGSKAAVSLFKAKPSKDWEAEMDLQEFILMEECVDQSMGVRCPGNKHDPLQTKMSLVLVVLWSVF